jgi:hypothetical protein
MKLRSSQSDAEYVTPIKEYLDYKENANMNDISKDQRYASNLRKSLQLSHAAMILKKAFLRLKNPSINDQELEKVLINDIFRRKNASWELTARKFPH